MTDERHKVSESIVIEFYDRGETKLIEISPGDTINVTWQSGHSEISTEQGKVIWVVSKPTKIFLEFSKGQRIVEGRALISIEKV